MKDTPENRADPFAPRFWPGRLALPAKWTAPRRVFVNSMSDVFHAHFSLTMIQQLFEIMVALPQHQFQLLTKRPERAARLAADLPWGPNIWMGTSIENMDVAHRADSLRRITQANVRFISAEPLLASLAALDLRGIHWVIGGGESGPNHRPVRAEWARELRRNCVRAGIAFFWKQWGGFTPKAGGRDLDGRTWDEYPVALAMP